MNFRDANFALCKYIKSTELSKNTAALIRQLHTSKDNQEIENRSSFGSLASSINAHFFSYIIVDADRDSIIKSNPFITKIPHLTKNETALLKQSHSILTKLINLCLSDFKVEAPSLYCALNPYSDIRGHDENIDDNVLVGFEDAFFYDCAKAFKETPSYKLLTTSHTWSAIKGLSFNELMQFIMVMRKEVYSYDFDEVSPELTKLKINRLTATPSQVDIIANQAYIMFSLREMLFSSCQLVFRAITGGELIILNNDNIVSIDGPFSNLISKGVSVTSIDLPLMHYLKVTGDIVLLNCQRSDYHKLNEFGRIEGASFNRTSEEGEIMHYSIRFIDESLNPFQLRV